MQKIPIQTAKSTDCQRIYEIHMQAVQEGCKNDYTPAQLTAWLKNKNPQGYLEAIEKGEMFVAKKGSHTIGFGHAIPGEVVGIFVDPEIHLKGVGKILLAKAIQIAKEGYDKIFVESTLNAANFYAKYGFKEKERKSLMRNGQDIPIIVMEKNI